MKVDLREIWKNEEYDFSKWLVEEENLVVIRPEYITAGIRNTQQRL